MNSKWLIVGAVNGLIAVGAGAFGAHVLKTRLDADAMNAFDVGVRYQMYHALALLAVAWMCHAKPSRAATGAGVCMFLGIILFTGSLFGLSLLGWRWLGPVTPLGGVSFMVGWLLLAIAAMNRRGVAESPAI